jgi:Flp pilus assembly protein TadD
MFSWVLVGLLAFSAPAPLPPSGPVARMDIMALPPALQARLHDDVLAGRPAPTQRLQRLVHFAFDPDGLGITYGDGATHSVAESYATRKANCLAFTMLFLAMARDAGLEAYPQELGETLSWRESGGTIYRDNHINAGIRIGGHAYTVDVAGGTVIGLHPPVRVSDERLLAHYYNNLAAEAFERGDAAGAQRDMAMALSLDMAYAPHWSNAGVLYLHDGNAPAAERAYLKALSLEPANASALFNMMELLHQAGDPREADFRRRLSRVQQNDPLQHFVQAMDYERLGNYVQAIEHYRRAIQLHRGEHRFHSALAHAYLRAGDTRRAARALMQAQYLSEGPTRAAYQAERKRLQQASN